MLGSLVGARGNRSQRGFRSSVPSTPRNSRSAEEFRARRAGCSVCDDKNKRHAEPPQGATAQRRRQARARLGAAASGPAGASGGRRPAPRGSSRRTPVGGGRTTQPALSRPSSYHPILIAQGRCILGARLRPEIPTSESATSRTSSSCGPRSRLQPGRMSANHIDAGGNCASLMHAVDPQGARFLVKLKWTPNLVIWATKTGRRSDRDALGARRNQSPRSASRARMVAWCLPTSSQYARANDAAGHQTGLGGPRLLRAVLRDQ